MRRLKKIPQQIAQLLFSKANQKILARENSLKFMKLDLNNIDKIGKSRLTNMLYTNQ